MDHVFPDTTTEAAFANRPQIIKDLENKFFSAMYQDQPATIRFQGEEQGGNYSLSVLVGADTLATILVSTDTTFDDLRQSLYEAGLDVDFASPAIPLDAIRSLLLRSSING